MAAPRLCFEVAEVPPPAPMMMLRHIAMDDGTAQHPHCGGRPSDVWPFSLARTHRQNDAACLNEQLRQLDAPQHLIVGLGTRLPRLAASVGSLLQPQGTTHNDNSAGKRAVNIITSLPFLAIGAHMLRRYRTVEGREYAMSMLAVGAAATAYHASSGRARHLLRKLDYWTIAASSTCMLKTLWPERRWVRGVLNASLVAVPFKPFIVSSVHTIAMQTEFARQATMHEDVRPHFRRHAVAAAAGAVAFAVEDYLADRGFGHAHGIWHLLAAGGVATAGALVEHKESLRLSETKAPSRRGGMTSGLRGCTHDSVTSLSTLGGFSK